MSFVLADRVKETTTTTGVGVVTLDGAVTGFQDFDTAIGDGNKTYYVISHQSADEWEVGIGTFTSATSLLSRDTVLSSSNGGVTVSFSAGTKDVFVSQPATKAVYVDNSGVTAVTDLEVSTELTVFAGTPLTSISTGTGDNDKLVTQGYVDDADAVAGADTQVIFNDGGSAYGGHVGLVYNKAASILTVASILGQQAVIDAVQGTTVLIAPTEFRFLGNTLTSLSTGTADNTTLVTQGYVDDAVDTPTISDFTNAAHGHQDAAGGGTLDHGLALAGTLGDDDHTQYALLAGRAGNQTLTGGTAVNGILNLRSTAGVGTSSYIIFKTGNAGNVTCGVTNDNGGWGFGVFPATTATVSIGPTDAATGWLNFTGTKTFTTGGTKNLVRMVPTILPQARINNATVLNNNFQISGSLPSVTFTGSGLDDMTAGSYFTGNTALDYKVEIDGTGTPDTFRWSDDGGSTWDESGVAITGAAQTLENLGGVKTTVTFGATTGHTLADYWEWTSIVVNIINCYAQYVRPTLTGYYGGTVTNATGVYTADASLGVDVTGGITNQRGLYVPNLKRGSAVNRALDLNVGALSDGGYNVYAGGTAPNYFAGDTGFGTNQPSTRLDVANGAVEFSIMDPPPASGVADTVRLYAEDDGSGNTQLKARFARFISVATFTGAGLDDMTTGGAFTGSSNLDYRVEIDGEGTPDTFKWSDDGGSTWDVETVAITGAAQTLNNGVTVIFGATTGHTAADIWDFSANAGAPAVLAAQGGSISYGSYEPEDVVLKTAGADRLRIVSNNGHTAVSAYGAVGAGSFTGSGTDDMITGGSFTGTSELNYKVEIDANGSPDTFKWSDDGGSTWDATGVSITGNRQTLNNGISVAFYTKGRSINAVIFTGIGLDDLSTGGAFTGSSDLNYRVEIDGEGTPDTFKWSDDGGVTWDAETVSITGAAQTLNNGVTITFAATTGHTEEDAWEFTTTASVHTVGDYWEFTGTPNTATFLELVSVEQDSNVSILQFCTTANTLSTAEIFGRINGVITQADPSTLKGELVFYVNTGDSINEAVRIHDDLHVRFLSTIDASGTIYFGTAEQKTTGTTPTIDLDGGNHHWVDADQAGALTVTLDGPTGVTAGTIAVKQGGTARDITWTAGSGINSIEWLGNEPVWLDDANTYRMVAWRFSPESSGTLFMAGGTTWNLVEDTSPQLGGDLDANGNTIHFGTAENTQTPAGTTATIDLGAENHHTLDCGSASGDVTLTLTVPPGPSAGTIVIQQNGTARDITWAASSGTCKWLGTEPTWNGDASKFRIVSWRYWPTSPEYIFLSATETD